MSLLISNNFGRQPPPEREASSSDSDEEDKGEGVRHSGDNAVEDIAMADMLAGMDDSDDDGGSCGCSMAILQPQLSLAAGEVELGSGGSPTHGPC